MCCFLPHNDASLPSPSLSFPLPSSIFFPLVSSPFLSVLCLPYSPPVFFTASPGSSLSVSSLFLLFPVLSLVFSCLSSPFNSGAGVAPFLLPQFCPIPPPPSPYASFSVPSSSSFFESPFLPPVESPSLSRRLRHSRVQISCWSQWRRLDACPGDRASAAAE